MKGIISLIFLLAWVNASAESFNQLLSKLDKHDLLRAQLDQVNLMRQKARKQGSFGDPKLSIAAINFPKDTLAQDESMMTGIQVGLSQQFSLSGKYGKLRESGEEEAKSYLADARQLKREFIKELWKVSILKEKLIHEQKILKENLDWIRNNLKITKRLYSTGKVPQQAVLDIQIRKNELQALVDQNAYLQQSLKHELSVLLNSEQLIDIDLESVPWKLLEDWKKNKESDDYKKLALEHQLKASDLNLSAQNRNYIPDITFGINYTKRNELDGIGDFVGASITIPIPSSDIRYAAKKEAVFQKMQAQKKYRNYLTTKPNVLRKMEFEIKDVENQISLLKRETLKFAESSRDVTAKSYSRGGADYLELLRAELQYQNQRMKEVNLIASRKMKQVDYLYFKGVSLTLGSTK